MSKTLTDATLLLNRIYGYTLLSNGRLWREANKSIAEKAQLNNWPERIIIACLFHDLWTFDHLIYEQVLDEIAKINNDAVKIIETITKNLRLSEREALYHLSQSPDAKTVMWLVILDYLSDSHNKHNIPLYLEALPKLFPDHLI